MADKIHKEKKKRTLPKGMKPWTKEEPPTKEMIEKRKETRKLNGRFREVAINMLESGEQTIKKNKIMYYVDIADRVLDPSEPISKIYAVVFNLPNYEMIVGKMIQLAASGDDKARAQLIELAQGYKEQEAQTQEAFAEFLAGITVNDQIPLDITPYDELNRTID